MRRPCAECGRVMMSVAEWAKTPPAERTAPTSHRGRGLCARCYCREMAPPRTRTPRAHLVEDVADLLEANPTMTTAGLAVRLGRSRDSITMALRRSARDGDERAIRARAVLADSPRWKDIAA